MGEVCLAILAAPFEINKSIITLITKKEMVEASGLNRAASNSEADKAFKKGKKAITTSLFKWSADYLEGSL